MATIIPAIIPTSLEHLASALAPFGDVAPEVQIDIVDGKFVPYTSWPYRDKEAHIESLTTALPLGMAHELDLMISEPRESLSVWLATKPSRIVIHVESLPDDDAVADAIMLIKEHGVVPVLSADNDTPLARIEKHIERIGGIQCMGIKDIGVQGNSFDERVLARIAELHERHPDFPISVDGSVNKESILALYGAGASRFAVGSALFGTEDPVGAYRELLELVT